MLFSLACKNIFRNTRRTVLCASAIFLVALVLILLFAFEHGMIDDMEENVKAHMTGDIRIRNQLFSDNERIQPIQFYIPDAQGVLDQVLAVDGVVQADVKTSSSVSIYRNDQTSMATVIGVDVASSPFLHGTGVTILEGALPEAESRQVAITDSLSHSLGLGVGDKFTFIGQTATRGTNGGTATVSAVVRLSDTDFSGDLFFMDWKVLATLLRMPGGALEILVRTEPGADLAVIVGQLQSTLAGSDFEVLPWTQANILYQMFQLVDLIYLYISMFFFLIASTVIFNTTMMSVLERKREIGTLVSLGYGSRKVMGMFLMENALISFFASLLGTLVGVVAVAFMHHYGFDLNAMGGSSMSGMNFSNYIYPSLTFSICVMVVLMGTAMAVLACLIPARKVLKIQPAAALRAEN